ncbi:hypothetical protein LT702_22780 [Pseudomonas syringae pv. syringae]|uniref:hypothetical protein n=1 Tax=Pseudomonas syringae TaxID=317 RepID=UPI00200A3509|nr:hypothetical protein [Pseudomonas syringae]MCK9754416.1 hypothetical protein [Pseudomonas syringae pv. syringae]
MQKQWDNVKKMYIESNRIFSYQRLRLLECKRDFIPLLVSTLLVALLSSGLYWLKNPTWPLVVMIGAAISMQVFFITINKILAKLYVVEYERHNISAQRQSDKINLLAYAFFLQKIKSIGYTPRLLEAISEYSETLDSPPKSFLINQNFINVIVISTLVSLFVAYLQKTSAWPTQALEYIFFVASLGVVVSLILDGFRTATTRNARIRQYLRRAKVEIEQEANS